MMYVTIDYSAEYEDWHMKVLERLIRGIGGLEREGYKIEQFTEFENRQPLKRLLVISRLKEGEGALEI